MNVAGVCTQAGSIAAIRIEALPDAKFGGKVIIVRRRWRH